LGTLHTVAVGQTSYLEKLLSTDVGTSLVLCLARTRIEERNLKRQGAKSAKGRLMPWFSDSKAPALLAAVRE
jgi:hypothetical protein